MSDDPPNIDLLTCYDCGLPYGSPKWADVVVPDEYWRMIWPSDDGGVLCFSCMVGRFATLGLTGNVPFSVTSGPFCFSPRNYVNRPA